MTRRSGTRRALLRTPSTKNQWPQHPKIQDRDRRDAAYLRVAGLAPSSSSLTATDAVALASSASPELKFGRLLGGTDARTRHKAVRLVRSYLQAQCQGKNQGQSTEEDINANGLSFLDLLKLCKALWHTLYMADQSVVQDELSHHLARLLECVAEPVCENHSSSEDEDEDEDEEDTMKEEEEEEKEDGDEQERIMHHRSVAGPQLLALFVRSWLITIRREWHAMDKYRVDKFYTLLRYLLRHVFMYLTDRNFPLRAIECINDALFQEALSQTPNGLRNHLIDIVLEELAHVLSTRQGQGSEQEQGHCQPITEAVLMELLEPYFELAKHCDDDSVQKRVLEKVLMRFLHQFSPFVCNSSSCDRNHNGSSRSSNTTAENVDDADANANASYVVFSNVQLGPMAQFLLDALASAPDTYELYRPALYDVYKAYQRAAQRQQQLAQDQQPQHPPPSSSLLSEKKKMMIKKKPSKKKEEERVEKNQDRVVVETTPAETASAAETETSSKDHYLGEPGGTIIDKKKRKEEKKHQQKKKKRKHVVFDVVETTTKQIDEVVDDDEEQKKKKKKIKCIQEGDASTADPSSSHPQHIQTPALSGPKSQTEESVLQDHESKINNKKKKKKKKNNQDKIEREGCDPVIEEEEHLISVQMQRAAQDTLEKQQRQQEQQHQQEKEGEQKNKAEFMQLVKTKGKKKQKNNKQENGGEVVVMKKRVKIMTQNNIARSWSDSMEGLRTMSSPSSAASPTPNNGILHNKHAAIPVLSTPTMNSRRKQQRRRAIDYF